MAITRVSGQTASNNTTGTTTVDLAMPGNVTAGNLIAVAAIGDNADTSAWTLAKQTGTATVGTPVKHVTDVSGGNTNSCAIWTVEVTGTGSLTLRVSHSSSTYWVAAASEYSGADVTGTRLEDSDTNASDTSAETVATNSMTSAGGALFFGVIQTYFSDNVADRHVPGTNWSEVYEEADGSSYMTGSIIDRIVTSGTSDSANWSFPGTNPATNTFSAVGVVIKAAAGGDGSVTGVAGSASASAPAPAVGGGGGAGTITRVSGQTVGSTNPSASASYDVAFPGNVTAGNMIVAVASRYAVGTRTAFADGGLTKLSGTATIDTSVLAVQQVPTGGTDTMDVAILTALVTGTGSLTVRLQSDSNNYYWFAAVAEYAGSWDASRLEDTSADWALFSYTSNASPSSGDATSAGAALFVGGLSIGHTAASITEDAAFGLIGEEEDWDNGMAGSAIDRIVSSGTTDAAAWTCTGAALVQDNSWAAVVAVFKEASTGGAEVTGVAGAASASAPAPEVVGGGGAGTIFSTVEL